jgi:tRNA-modifying protein YgfZ
MLLDLTERAKFKVTGEDRLRFLNGQLTNDLVGLAPGRAIYACALTAKGKLCADLFVTSITGAFYFDTAPVLQSSLLARLERYIISDDVLIEDVTGQFGLFHFLNQKPEEHAKCLNKLETTVASLRKESFPIFTCESNRFAAPGPDLWFPRSSKSSILETLQEKPSSADDAENLRIERGIAAWGSELSEDVLPNEADLQGRAISYTKGCYLGQEVISRIKSIGHVNRCLRGLVPLDNVLLQPGDKLISDAESMKPAGSITSVGKREKSGQPIALGYVRRGFDKPGTALQLSRNNSLIGSVQVRSLPFD